MHLAGRDMDENGNRTTQVDDGVCFDRSLGRAEICPGEECQTQIDGCGVQRVERFLEPRTDVLAVMQFDRYGNQSMTGAPRTVASRVARWHRPRWNEISCRESRCGKAWRVASSGKPQGRASPRVG